jgi:nucleotide-binding universal stress UspA family protein
VPVALDREGTDCRTKCLTSIVGSPQASWRAWRAAVVSLAKATTDNDTVNDERRKPLGQPTEEYFADVTRRIARVSEVSMTPMIVEASQVAGKLADLVASASDLVVMATRGRTAIGRIFIGSALDAVLQRMRAPLLHVRGYACPVDLTARPSLRHALVPLDGSSRSACVLEPVAALSKLSGGRQSLLHVVPSTGIFSCGDGSSGRHGQASELQDRPLAQVDEIAKSWRAVLPHARASVVWSDRTSAREILLQADECEADFIALATRRRGRLGRLVRPGVFDQLIRRGRTPILVVNQRYGDACPAAAQELWVS